MSFKSSFTEFGAKAKFSLEKHSPELCLIGGIIGFGVTIFLACKQTTKTEEVLDQYAEAKKKIEDAKKAAADTEIPEEDRPVYTEEDAKKAQFVAMRNLFFGMVKKYWPVALSGVISVGLFLTSYKIVNGRFVGVLGAYTALDEGFRRYRDRVVDVVGEEKEREIRTGVKKEKGCIKEQNEYGEEVVVEKDVDQMVKDYDGITTVLWNKDTAPDAYQGGDQMYNKFFLDQIEEQVNREFLDRKFIFEKDVRRMLGLKITPESCIKGWIVDPANPPLSIHPICFRAKPIFSESGQKVLYDGKMVNSLSGWSYLLEFDSTVIWNLVGIWENSR